MAKGQVVPLPSSPELWLVPLDSLQEWVLVGDASHVWPVLLGQQLGLPVVLASMGLGWVEEARNMGGGTPIGIGVIMGGGGKFTCGGYA